MVTERERDSAADAPEGAPKGASTEAPARSMSPRRHDRVDADRSQSRAGPSREDRRRLDDDGSCRRRRRSKRDESDQHGRARRSRTRHDERPVSPPGPPPAAPVAEQDEYRKVTACDVCGQKVGGG